MTVIAGTFVGYAFALLALAMMRMGAFHLHALPGMPQHLTGLPLVLPMVHDLTGKGIAMVAAGWAVASFVGAYMAGLIARSTVAATLVQLGLTAGAVVLATQGVEPWWMAGGSVPRPPPCPSPRTIGPRRCARRRCPASAVSRPEPPPRAPKPPPPHPAGTRPARGARPGWRRCRHRAAGRPTGRRSPHPRPPPGR